MRKVTLIAAALAALVLGAPTVAQESSTPPVPPTASDEGGSAIANPFASRGAALPAVLRYLQGQGVPLVFLGDEGGLKGYLAEDASGRNQVLYVSPDGEHMIAGLMFASGGQQVSSRQITKMMARFREAAATAPGVDASTLPEAGSMTDIVVSDGPIIEYFRDNGLTVSPIEGRDGGVDAFLVDRPASEGVARLQQVFYVAPDDRYAVAGVMLRRGGVNVTGLQIAKMQERYLAERNTAAAGQSVIAPGANPPPVPQATFPAPPPPAENVQQESTAPASAAGGLTLPQGVQNPSTSAPAAAPAALPVSTAPVEAAEAYRNTAIDAREFLTAVNEGSVYFTVGLPNRPALYMVADPQCPFCHRMWTTLQPMVESGEIQVRVILIAGLQGSDPLVRSLLSKPNPSVAWLQGQGSRDNFPIDPAPGVGTPEWLETGRYLSINMEFISRFEIQTTPFLAYVAGDDALYTSRGIPTDPDAFLAALR